MIALRAYFDSSGKVAGDYITLAAFAGNEEMWDKFETDWSKILKEHAPQAKYVHMREIAHQRGGFDREHGWNDQNAFGLATS